MRPIQPAWLHSKYREGFRSPCAHKNTSWSHAQHSQRSRRGYTCKASADVFFVEARSQIILLWGIPTFQRIRSHYRWCDMSPPPGGTSTVVSKPPHKYRLSGTAVEMLHKTEHHGLLGHPRQPGRTVDAHSLISANTSKLPRETSACTRTLRKCRAPSANTPLAVLSRASSKTI